MSKDKEKLLLKYLNNECSDEELEQIAGLFKDPETEKELSALFERALEKTEPDLEITREHSQDLWHKIQAGIKPDVIGELTSASSKPRQFYSSVLFRIAASLLIFICIGYLLVSKFILTEKPVAITYKTVEAPLGSRKVLRLPDGTIAHINSGTKITYPSDFNHEIRRVVLTGEAFFEVMKDEEKPFVIESNGVYTKVVGTSFNVSSYDQQPFQLTLVTGKVEVTTDSTDEAPLVIYPNEQILYNRDRHEVTRKEIDVTQFIGWKEGSLVLRGDFLTELKKIERWYDKKIIIGKKFNKCHIDASYNDQPLNYVLDGLSYILDFEYKITGDTVTISGNGC